MKMANNMALGRRARRLVVVGICAAIFFHTFGTQFMIAANGGGIRRHRSRWRRPYFFLIGGLGRQHDLHRS